MQFSLFWRIMRTLAKNSKKVREKLFCPLTSAIIQIIFAYFLFYHFFPDNTHYSSSVGNAKIKSKIEAHIDQCGPEYWITWIVFDASKLQNKFFFQDVIGCNPNKKGKCAFSVKDNNLNKFYDGEYHVDDASLNFLSNLETGVGMFCDDLNYCFNRTRTIKTVISSTNKKINSLSLAVTKDIKKNIVFVFAMSNTNDYLTKCNRDKMTRIVEDLSIYAQEVF